MKTTSKILNRGEVVKRAGVAALLHRFGEEFQGGAGVLYILACLLGVPLSLIVLFLLTLNK